MHVVSFIFTSVSSIFFCEPSFLLSGCFLDVNIFWWFRSRPEGWEGWVIMI
jgi:hypothetical protein